MDLILFQSTQPMDIENKWAKSTECRLEMFLDDYLIKSSVQRVRHNSQRLLLSLFKKGNPEQQLRILTLVLDRCEQLPQMGRASQDFLQLVKNIFTSSSEHGEKKGEILRAIMGNLETIYGKLVKEPNYEFYAFASNLINFGNEQFKPYLLQANGCLRCFGRGENKPEFMKLDSVQSMQTVFTNKLEIIFKRHYEIKDLNITIKTSGRFRSLSVYYRDLSGELVHIGKDKYKPGEAIPHENVTASGLMFVFEPNSNRRSVECVFCGGRESKDESNYVCSGCTRRSDKLDVCGTFKVVGADPQKIASQLCQDFPKLRSNIGAIKDLHVRILSKQKINLQLGLDEMLIIYERIVNNLSLLHAKNPSSLVGNLTQNCFSCNYYETVSIVTFLKELVSREEGLCSIYETDKIRFKAVLRGCLKHSQIESLKLSLLETLAGFIALDNKFEQEILSDPYGASLMAQLLVIVKSRKNSQDLSGQLRKIFTKEEFLKKLTAEEKIKIFVCYYLESEVLSTIDRFNSSTEIPRLAEDQVQEVRQLIDFDLSKLFNLNLNVYLKAFLKLLPPSLLPKVTLDISNSEFLEYLQYTGGELPEISEQQIKDSIICCPHPTMKLNMFACLPTLIESLSAKDAGQLMNRLFPYKNAWNLNVIMACKFFEEKLEKMPPEEQIYTCLNGYRSCQEYIYIQKLHKLLVPQRMKFIIKLEYPLDEIERMQVEYPFISIREVRSEELQGDTIQALHDWVYGELAKNNSAMPLDIIVEKNIIDSMNLPIEVVYQNIAENKSRRIIGDKSYEYFKVIYRVQGILGEPKQRSIGNPRDQKLEACIAHSSHFLDRFNENSKSIGLDVLIEILQSIQPTSECQAKKMLVFEILSTLSLNEGICKKIVEGQYGDSIINATVRLLSFENEKDAKVTNFLLELSSKVIDEANQEMINLRKGSKNDLRKFSGMDIESEGGMSESMRKVKFVLEKFNECEANYESTKNVLYRDIAKRLIKLVPFCSKDELESTTMIFEFFDLGNWSTKSSSKLDYMLIFMESLSESYMTFKSIARSNGVTDDIIKAIITGVRKNGEEGIDEKKFPHNRTMVESALLLLCSLIQGDEGLQKHLLDNKLFHNIYEISLIPPKKTQELNAGRIPENCYRIIKYLGEGRIVEPEISKFLAEKKSEGKAKMAPKKNKKWEEMKNKQKNALAGKMDDHEERDFIICSSCQEGYSKRKDILGLYIYQTKHEIPLSNSWWKDRRRTSSFTSSTFFTAIHYDCHMRAFEADQKIPRSEWDGALIRNMDVLCNSWVPFKGPKTSSEEIARTEKKYFEQNKNGSYWNIVTDLNCLLEKLSREFDFATESKGSSSLHNFRYIPILMGFALHFLEKQKGDKNMEEGVSFLLEHPPKKLSTINLFLCCCLFELSRDKFEQHKKTFFEWIISCKKEETTPEQWFKESKMHLVYLKLVEQIYAIVHAKIPKEQAGEPLTKSLDTAISSSLQAMVQELDKLNDRYKSEYIKYGKAEEFNF